MKDCRQIHRQRKQSLLLSNTDPDRLNLRVVVQSIRTQLATQPGLLETTKRHLVVECVVAVDPDSAVKTFRLAMSLLLDNQKKGRHTQLSRHSTPEELCRYSSSEQQRPNLHEIALLATIFLSITK